jgi:glutamine synthetase
LAGFDGIKKKIQPPDPVDLDTYKLSKYEMKKFGVKQLPTSLQEAISSLKSDNEFLSPIIDDDFLDMYLSILETQT